MEPTEYIEIRDAADNTAAFLTPDADKIKDCWIDRRSNEESTLNFNIPPTSPKLAELNPESRIVADGREFVILRPEASDTVRDDRGQLWTKVMAQESWMLLGKIHPTINNDPDYPWPEDRKGDAYDDPDHGWIVPDALVVTIISGGDDLSGGLYSPGTAAHALYALLKGTDWTLGTVDVTGTRDLETEKQSTLANINEVQSIWGGLLVWEYVLDENDRITERKLHLRDEDSWQNYEGFQVRYAKNLKHITRTDNNDIVTKLYPFGENDLDIYAVNDEQKYLEDYSYTNTVLTDTYINQKIHDQEELKEEATKVLSKVSSPRHTYRVKIADLRTLPEYQHEDFMLGDIVDIIDEELNINTQARIVRHRYNVFMPWQCELEIGEPEERLVANLARMADVSKYVRESLRPNPASRNFLKGFLNTFATKINSADGKLVWDDTTLEAIEVDGEGEETGKRVRLTPGGIGVSLDGGQTYETAITAGQIFVTDSFIVATEDGFTKLLGNGLKVFDNEENVRVHLGQYDTGKYGLLVREGEIYATKFQTGTEASDTYVLLEPNGDFSIYNGGNRIAFMQATAAEGRLRLTTTADHFDGLFLTSDFTVGTFDCAAVISDGDFRDGLYLNSGGDGHCLITRAAHTRLEGADALFLNGFNVIEMDSINAGLVDGTKVWNGFRVVSGNKDCTVYTEDYNSRALSCFEMPSAKFGDEGIAEVKNGICRVDIDPIFLQCLEPNTKETPFMVHLTPYDWLTLRVKEIGDSYFIVEEKDKLNGKFAWSLTGFRIGYADRRLDEYDADIDEVLDDNWEDEMEGELSRNEL